MKSKRARSGVLEETAQPSLEGWAVCQIKQFDRMVCCSVLAESD
jgi:hypothetical protein